MVQVPSVIRHSVRHNRNSSSGITLVPCKVHKVLKWCTKYKNTKNTVLYTKRNRVYPNPKVVVLGRDDRIPDLFVVSSSVVIAIGSGKSYKFEIMRRVLSVCPLDFQVRLILYSCLPRESLKIANQERNAK